MWVKWTQKYKSLSEETCTNEKWVIFLDYIIKEKNVSGRHNTCVNIDRKIEVMLYRFCDIPKRHADAKPKSSVMKITATNGGYES